MTGIYIHIPFCNSKCPYCDFYSFKADEKQKDGYLKAVLFCLDKYKDTLTDTVDTIYFGGGTPSVFGGERIGEIINHIKKGFKVCPTAEITVECNPSSVTAEFVNLIAIAGANRISMGMQSAVTTERLKLGRHSDTDKIRECITLFKNEGIDNISLDLMLGVPGQNEESLDESIDFLLSSGIKHISAYMLKVEEGTPYHTYRNSLNLPDEDETCDMYLHTVKRLSENGFMQYEVSNFCRDGYHSRHNLHYWHCDEYLGIGPSAHSFLNGKRFYFGRDFESFLTDPTPVPDGEGGSEEEYIMLNLRLNEGLSGKRYYERFGKHIDKQLFEKAEGFEKMGLVKIDGDTIRLNEKGFLLSNTIIGELI